MKRVNIFPSDRARAALGDAGPALTEAAECWAECVTRAGAEVAGRLAPAEWHYLADMLRGTRMEPSFGDPGAILAADAADADAHEGLGEKWGADPAALAGKLAGLSYAQAWAVVLACRWFWAAGKLPRGAAWWEPAYRARRAAGP